VPTARDDRDETASPYSAQSNSLVIGEAITDVVVTDGTAVDHAGGSPLNVAYGVARLGLRSSLVTRIGDDARGDALAEHVRASGAQLSLPAVRGAVSATATTTIDEKGGAHYDFDIEWLLPELHLDLAGFSLAHLGSIAAFLQPGAAVAEDLITRARSTAIVTYDPNIRPQLLSDVSTTRSDVERQLALVDLAKASDEDLAWLYPDLAFETALERWLELGPAVAVVTRGAEGAFAVSRSGVRLAVPGVATQLVDTIGAGDSFMAALITGLAMEGLDGASSRSALQGIGEQQLTRIVTRATVAAAITVSRAGANPPTAAELQGRLRAGA
jgi:fructokinase